MTKCLKFASLFILENLMVLFGFAVIVLVGCLFTGVPSGAENLFTTYYGMFPFMYLLIIFIASFAWCTTNLNLGLSYGCRRRDFFLATQVQVVLYILFGFALNQIMLAIPKIGNWNNSDLRMMALFDLPLPLYILLTAALVLAGCTLGPLYMRSRIIGTVLMVVIIFLGIGATVAIMFLSHDPIRTWGQLPTIISIALFLVCALCEGLLYRFIHKATVR